MPNHFHGIIIIEEDQEHQMDRKPLGRLIGVFKTLSTKRINQHGNTPGKQFWQRNYYEHIIRNEKELALIREYIMLNPVNWSIDSYFLDR